MAVKRGRQWGRHEGEIRTDHRRRYHWAGHQLSGMDVLDLGCGIGYGSWIMAKRGCFVTGFDSDAEAIDHGWRQFAHENARLYQGDIVDLAIRGGLPPAEAVVLFEVLEHLPDDTGLLRRIGLIDKPKIQVVLGSVPNKDIQPDEAGPDQHYRHYTPEMLARRFAAARFPWIQFWYQSGKRGARSEIVEGPPGPTIVFAAKR